MARIEALLQELVETRETTLRVGPLELDLIQRRAKRGERPIELRAREFRLLEYMMRRSNQILTRTMLFEGVWDHKSIASSNILDVHIGHLRRKVDGPDDLPMIYNVRGAGFVIRRAN
jgi:two-component system OmpR family response regulator